MRRSLRRWVSELRSEDPPAQEERLSQKKVYGRFSQVGFRTERSEGRNPTMSRRPFSLSCPSATGGGPHELNRRPPPARGRQFCRVVGLLLFGAAPPAAGRPTYDVLGQHQNVRQPSITLSLEHLNTQGGPRKSARPVTLLCGGQSPPYPITGPVAATAGSRPASLADTSCNRMDHTAGTAFVPCRRS